MEDFDEDEKNKQSRNKPHGGGGCCDGTIK